MPIALRLGRLTVALSLLAAVAACLPAANLPQAAATGEDHVVAAPLGLRTGAYLTVRDAASRVRVELVNLPGLLYRISTPADSGLAPVATGTGGRIQTRFRRTGADGPDDVRIVLNRAVRWDIRLPAGAGEQQLDLAAGRVSRVDVGACGLVELRLPRPGGTLPVTFTSGVGTVVMAVADAPVGLRMDGGAGAIVTPWAVRAAMGSGAALAERGWAAARDRYAVRSRAGLGNLTLSRISPVPR